MKTRFVLLLLLLAVGVFYGCDQEDEWAPHSINLNQALVDKHIGRFYFNREQGGLDSVDEDVQLVLFPGHGRIRCEIFAKDVVLGREDSLRIGIIRPLEVVFGFPKTIELPDQIILSPYGQDTIPISLDQENVGAVTRSTVFRINRNFYSLNSLDSTRQHIEVAKLKRKPGSKPVASMKTRFKQVSVRRLTDGKQTVVRRQKGKETILYFWSLGVRDGASLLDLKATLDSIGQEAPALISINRADSKANLQKFVEEYEIDFPLYQNTGSTCSGLQCHPLVPYAVLVNASGRIVTHYLKHEDLMARLEE